MAKHHELPGLWFTPTELYALMVSWQLLSELQPGLASRYIEPAREDIGRRIRILQIAARPTDLTLFQHLSRALFERQRIRVLYRGRGRDKITERNVSPQRLVYYRIESCPHQVGQEHYKALDHIG